MIEVTKERFFSYVGPRDIVSNPGRDYAMWETRNRVQVGKSTPGYMCQGRKAFFLTESAMATLNSGARRDG